MDNDEELAIIVMCLVFGLGLICMLTIFSRSFCVEEVQGVALEDTVEGDYAPIIQANPPHQ